MNVWIGDSDHIFGRMMGTLFWTQLNTYSVLISPFISSIEYEVFHKKYALINITTLFDIIFHKFHQFPSIFPPFPDTMVFSIPFQRFPTSKVALMHPQGQSVDQKARHVLGPGTWDGFFAQNEISFIIF